MFGDSNWIPTHCDQQLGMYHEWFNQVGRDENLVIIEIGAGSAVPTVRFESENRLAQKGTALIRINPREPEGPVGTLSIGLGGLEALGRLAAEVERLEA